MFDGGIVDRKETYVEGEKSDKINVAFVITETIGEIHRKMNEIDGEYGKDKEDKDDTLKMSAPRSRHHTSK